MTKISSEEVRQKAVHAITRLDYSERQVAEIFGVSTRTIRRWVTQYREEGQLAPRPHGHKKALFSDEDVARAQELLQAQPVAGKIDFSSSGGADAMASRFRPVPVP